VNATFLAVGFGLAFGELVTEAVEPEFVEAACGAFGNCQAKNDISNAAMAIIVPISQRVCSPIYPSRTHPVG
jgi:hypothetical protein